MKFQLRDADMMAGVPEKAPFGETLLVALAFDHHRLLLPQQETRSLESVLDVQRQRAVPPIAGTITLAGATWPVYCLRGDDLAVTAAIPANRRICLLLDDGLHRLAIVCDQIEMLVLPPRRYPLPPCLAKPEALVESLVVHETTVACLTTTARLAAYCQRGTRQGKGYG
ncbi:MAG TPA: hypothetical protein VEP67_03050 [Thiobacillaceae bacterium]|nr:hypothetical protein [Thiobacillaceae bacterium]